MRDKLYLFATFGLVLALAGTASYANLTSVDVPADNQATPSCCPDGSCFPDGPCCGVLARAEEDCCPDDACCPVGACCFASLAKVSEAACCPDDPCCPECDMCSSDNRHFELSATR